MIIFNISYTYIFCIFCICYINILQNSEYRDAKQDPKCIPRRPTDQPYLTYPKKSRLPERLKKSKQGQMRSQLGGSDVLQNYSLRIWQRHQQQQQQQQTPILRSEIPIVLVSKTPKMVRFHKIYISFLSTHHLPHINNPETWQFCDLFGMVKTCLEDHPS